MSGQDQLRRELRAAIDEHGITEVVRQSGTPTDKPLTEKTLRAFLRDESAPHAKTLTGIRRAIDRLGGVDSEVEALVRKIVRERLRGVEIPDLREFERNLARRLDDTIAGVECRE